MTSVTSLVHKLETNQGTYAPPNNDLGTFDYTYDTMSNPTAVAQSASMGKLDVDREYVYDSLNRLITARLTDTQDWSSARQKTSWYQYDDLGNRKTCVERDSSAMPFLHDTANCLTSWNSHAQSYDGCGNVKTAFSATGSVSYKYTYDHHNRLTGVYDALTGTNRKAAYTWDALGRNVRMICPASYGTGVFTVRRDVGNVSVCIRMPARSAIDWRPYQGTWH